MAFMVSVESVRGYLAGRPAERLDDHVRRRLADRVRSDIVIFAPAVEKLKWTQAGAPDRLGLDAELDAARRLLATLEPHPAG